MADKDLELGIVLDTSEAESSLKSLEDAVPKSLKRLIDNFEKLSKSLDKSVNKAMSAQQAQTKRTENLQKSFEKSSKEAAKAIDKLSKNIANLEKNTAFQKFEKGLQIKVKSFFEMSKAIEEVGVKIDSVFSNDKIKLTSKDIKSLLDNIKKISKDLNIDIDIDANKIIRTVNNKKKQLEKAIAAGDMAGVDKLKASVSKLITESFKVDTSQMNKEIKESIKIVGNANKNFHKALQEIKQRGTFKKNRKGLSPEELGLLSQKEKEMLDGKILEYQEAMKKVKDLEKYKAKIGVKDNKLVSDLHQNVKQDYASLKKSVTALNDEAVKLEHQKQVYQKKMGEVIRLGSTSIDKSFRSLPKEAQARILETEQKIHRRFNRKLKKIYDDNLKGTEGLVEDYDYNQRKALMAANDSKANRQLVARRHGSLQNMLRDIDRDYKDVRKNLEKVRSNIKKSEDEIMSLGRFNQSSARLKGIPDHELNRLKMMEKKKQIELRDTLSEMYDDSMRGIKKDKAVYEREKAEFIDKSMREIAAGQLQKYEGAENFLKRRVNEQNKRLSKRENEILKIENDYRARDFRETSVQVRKMAQSLEKMDDENSKNRARLLTKRAKEIAEGNAKSLRKFELNQDRHLDNYRQAIDKEKALHDREIKNKSNLANRIGLAITEKQKAEKRELDALRQRRRELEIERERIRRAENQAAAGYGTRGGNFFGGGRGGSGGGGGAGGMGGVPPDGFNRVLKRRPVQDYEEAWRDAGKAMDQAGRMATFLRTALFTLGAGLGVKSIRDYYDAWVSFSNRIKLVTDSVSELRNVQEELIAVSDRTAISLYQSGELFEKFSRAGNRYGLQNQAKIQLAELVAQTISISGSTAAGAKGAVTQFIQGLGTELRGQELMSVREQIPRLATAIAEGLDVPISKLKVLGEQGKITPNVIINSLLDMVPTIKKEFSDVTFTIAMSFERISNAVSVFIGKFFDSLNSEGGLSGAIKNVSDKILELANGTFFPDLISKLEKVIDVVKTLGAVWLGIFSTKMIAGFFMSFLKFGSMVRTQWQSIGREVNKLDKAKTFFGGALQDSQGNIYTASKFREEETKRRAGNPEADTNVTQARRSGGAFVAMGGALKMAGILGVISMVASAFLGITEKSGFLMKALETVTSYLGKMITALANVIDWVAIKIGLMDSPEEAKAKEREARRRADNVNMRKADMLERARSGMSPDNKRLNEEERKQIQAITATELDPAQDVLYKQKDKYTAFGSELKQNLDKAGFFTSDQQELESKIKSKSLIALQKNSQRIASAGPDNLSKIDTLSEEEKKRHVELINSDLALAQMVEHNQARAAAFAELAKGHQTALEEVTSMQTAIEGQKSEIKRTQALLEKTKNAEYEMASEDQRLREQKVIAAEKKLQENETKLNDLQTKLEESKQVIRNFAEETIADNNVADELKQIVKNVAGFGDDGAWMGGVLDEMEAQAQVVEETQQQYNRIEEKVGKIRARSEYEVAMENRNKVNEQTKKRIKSENDAAERSTEIQLGILKKSSERAAQSLAQTLPSIQKEHRLAMDKAQADFDIQLAEAQRDALSYTNNAGDLAMKEKVTLKYNPAYNKKVKELERQKKIAVQEAAAAREKSLIALRQELELEDKILSIQKKSYSLLLDAEGTFDMSDLEGKTDTMIKRITSEREMQQALAVSTAQYLSETGIKTKEEADELVERMNRGSMFEATTILEKLISDYAKENEEVSLEIGKILKSTQQGMVDFDKSLVEEMRQEVFNIKKENLNLAREQEIYQDVLDKFGDSMVSLEVQGGGPLAQITNKLINDAFQIESQRRRLLDQKQKIETQIALETQAGGEVNAATQIEFDANAEKLSGLNQSDKIAFNNSMIQSEMALAKMRAQNSIAEQRAAIQELKINREQNLMNLKQIESEMELAEIRSMRSKGVVLEVEEARKLMEIESQMMDAQFSNRRAMAIEQSNINLQEQIQANEFASKQMEKMAETEEEIASIKQLTVDFNQELRDSSEVILEQTLDQIDAEERIAKLRREAARDSKINASGLFGNASGLGFTYKMNAEQTLDNPAYADFFRLAGEQLSLDASSASRSFVFEEEIARLMGLGHVKGSSPDLDGLYRAKSLVDEFNSNQIEIATKIGSNNVDLFNKINHLNDNTDRFSRDYENSRKSGSLLLDFLNNEKINKLEELDLQSETAILNEMIVSGLEKGTTAYNNKMNQLIADNLKERAKSEAEIERQYLEGLRRPYEGLGSKTFKLMQMDSDQLKSMIQTGVLDDLGEMRGIEESEAKRYKGVSLESKARVATTQQVQELEKAQKALKEGNLLEAEAAQKMADYYGYTAKRIQELAVSWDNYNQKKRESLNITLMTERETAFSQIENTQRELGLQLELADLKKNHAHTESELAEVAHRRRREILTQQIADEEALLAIKKQSQLLELRHNYDAGTDEYNAGLDEINTRMLQEEKILDIQNEQKLITLEATERLRKLNQEQSKSIKSMQEGLSSLLGAYFSFIGSIFTSVFEAIFGERKDPRKEEEELNQARMKKLEKQKNDLAKEVSLRISTESNTVTSELVNVNQELVDTNRELIQTLRDKKDLRDAYQGFEGPYAKKEKQKKLSMPQTDYLSMFFLDPHGPYNQRLDDLTLDRKPKNVRTSILEDDFKSERFVKSSPFGMGAIGLGYQSNLPASIIKGNRNPYAGFEGPYATRSNYIGFSGPAGKVRTFRTDLEQEEEKTPVVGAIEKLEETVERLSREEREELRRIWLEEGIYIPGVPEAMGIVSGKTLAAKEALGKPANPYASGSLVRGVAGSTQALDVNKLTGGSRAGFLSSISEAGGMSSLKAFPPASEEVLAMAFASNYLAKVGGKSGTTGNSTSGSGSDTLLKALGFTEAIQIGSSPIIPPPRSRFGGSAQRVAASGGMGVAVQPRFSSHLFLDKSPTGLRSTPPPARSALQRVYEEAEFSDLENEQLFIPTFGFNKSRASSVSQGGIIDALKDYKERERIASAYRDPSRAISPLNIESVVTSPIQKAFKDQILPIFDGIIRKILPGVYGDNDSPALRGSTSDNNESYPSRMSLGDPSPSFSPLSVGTFPETPDSEIEGIVEAWIRNVVMNALSKQKTFGPNDGITAEFYPELRDEIRKQIQSTGDFYPKISKGQQDYDQFLKAYKGTSPFPSDLLVPAERISEQMIDIHYLDSIVNKEIGRILSEYVTPVINDPAAAKSDLEFANQILGAKLSDLSILEEKSIDMTNLITEFFVDLRQYHREIKAENSGSPLVYELATEKHSKGGLLRGPSHANGGINLGMLGGVRHEAEGGEYIIKKSSVDKLGTGFLDRINSVGSRGKTTFENGPEGPVLKMAGGFALRYLKEVGERLYNKVMSNPDVKVESRNGSVYVGDPTDINGIKGTLNSSRLAGGKIHSVNFKHGDSFEKRDSEGLNAFQQSRRTEKTAAIVMQGVQRAIDEGSFGFTFDPLSNGGSYNKRGIVYDSFLKRMRRGEEGKRIFRMGRKDDLNFLYLSDHFFNAHPKLNPEDLSSVISILQDDILQPDYALKSLLDEADVLAPSSVKSHNNRENLSDYHQEYLMDYLRNFRYNKRDLSNLNLPEGITDLFEDSPYKMGLDRKKLSDLQYRYISDHLNAYYDKYNSASRPRHIVDADKTINRDQLYSIYENLIARDLSGSHHTSVGSLKSLRDSGVTMNQMEDAVNFAHYLTMDAFRGNSKISKIDNILREESFMPKREGGREVDNSFEILDNGEVLFISSGKSSSDSSQKLKTLVDLDPQKASNFNNNLMKFYEFFEKGMSYSKTNSLRNLRSDIQDYGFESLDDYINYSEKFEKIFKEEAAKIYPDGFSRFGGDSERRTISKRVHNIIKYGLDDLSEISIPSLASVDARRLDAHNLVGEEFYRVLGRNGDDYNSELIPTSLGSSFRDMSERKTRTRKIDELIKELDDPSEVFSRLSSLFPDNPINMQSGGPLQALIQKRIDQEIMIRTGEFDEALTSAGIYPGLGTGRVRDFAPALAGVGVGLGLMGGVASGNEAEAATPQKIARLISEAAQREAEGKIKVAVDAVSGEQASLVRLSDIDDEEMVAQGSLSSTGYGRSYKVAFGMLNKDGTLDMVNRDDRSKLALTGRTNTYLVSRLINESDSSADLIRYSPISDDPARARADDQNKRARLYARAFKPMEEMGMLKSITPLDIFGEENPSFVYATRNMLERNPHLDFEELSNAIIFDDIAEHLSSTSPDIPYMTPQSADELVENFRMAMSPSMRGDLGFDPDDLALDFTFDDHLEHIMGMVGVREDLVDPLFELIDIATSSSVKNTEKAEHLRQALDSFDLDKSGYSSLASSYNEAYGMIVDGLSPHYEAAQNLYKLPNGLIVNRDGMIVDDSLQAIAQEAYLSLREVASPVDKMIQMAPDDSNGSDMLSIANIVLREIQKKAAAVAGAVGLGAGTASAGNVPYDIDEVLEKDQTSLLNPFGLSGNSQSIEETFGPELKTKLHDTTVFMKQVAGGALAAVLGAPADLFNTSVQAGHTLVGTLKDVVHGEEFEKALKARYRQSGKLPYLLKNWTSESMLMALRKGLPSGFAMQDRDLTEAEFWISLIPALVSPMRQGGILPKKGKSGYLVGPSHENGGIDLGVLSGVRHEAEGGEYIIRREAVNQLGVGTLDYLNETGTIPVNKRFKEGGGMHPSTYTTMSVSESNRMIRNELQDTVVNAYAEVLVLVGKMKKEIEASKREEYLRVRPLGLKFSRHRAGTGASSDRTVEEMMSGNNSSNPPFSEKFWKKGEEIGDALYEGVHGFGDWVNELHDNLGSFTIYRVQFENDIITATRAVKGFFSGLSGDLTSPQELTEEQKKNVQQYKDVGLEIEALENRLKIGGLDSGQVQALNNTIGELRDKHLRLGQAIDKLYDATGISQEMKEKIGAVSDPAHRRELLEIQEKNKFSSFEDLVDRPRAYSNGLMIGDSATEAQKAGQKVKDTTFFGQLFDFDKDSGAAKEIQKGFTTKIAEGFENFFREERADGTFTEASLGTGARKAGMAVAGMASSFGRGGQLMTGLAQGAMSGDPAAMGKAMTDFIMGNKKIQEVFKKFGDIITKILDPLAEVFVPVMEALGELFVELAEILVSLMPLFELLAQALSRVAKIAGAVMKPIGSMVDTVSNAFSGLVNGIAGIFGGGGTKSKDDRISDAIRSSIKTINKDYFEQFKRNDPFSEIIKSFDSLYDEADRLNSSSKKRGMKDEIDRARAELLLAEVNKDLIKSIRSLEGALTQLGEDIGLRLHQVYDMFSASGQLSFVDAINVTGHRSDIAKGMASGSGVYADGMIKDFFKREMKLDSNSKNRLTQNLTGDQALSLFVGGHEDRHRLVAQSGKVDGQYVMKYAGASSRPSINYDGKQFGGPVDFGNFQLDHLGDDHLRQALGYALSQELSLTTQDHRSGSDSTSYSISTFLGTGNAKNAVTDIMGQYFGDTDIGKLMLNNALGVLDEAAGSKVGSYSHDSSGNTYSHGMDGSRDGAKVTGQYINEMVDQFLTIPDLFREAVESIGGTLEQGKAAFDYIAADFSDSVRFALKSVEDGIHDFRDKDGNINYEYDPIKASQNIADISNMLSAEAYKISQAQDFSEAFRQNPRGQLGNQRDQIANELVDKLMGAEDDTGKRSGGLRDQLEGLDPVKDAESYLAVAKKIQIANEEAITKTLQLEIKKTESIKAQRQGLEDELNLRTLSEQQASQRLDYEKQLYNEGLGKFSDEQMTKEVDKYTENLKGLTDAFGDEIYNAEEIAKMGKEYENMLKTQNEEYDSLMSLFDRKQAIELEKSERELARTREDSIQSIYEQISAYQQFSSIPVPESLKDISGLGQKDIINRNRTRGIEDVLAGASVGVTQERMEFIEDFSSSGSDDFSLLGEVLGLSSEKAKELADSFADLNQEADAQKYLIDLQSEDEAKRLKISNNFTASAMDALNLQNEIHEIKTRQLSEELEAELILQKTQALRMKREEELNEINSSGYRYSSSIQEIEKNLNEELGRIAKTLADPDTDDETRDFELARQAALPAKAMREIAEINRQLLADLDSIGRNYSEIGNVNRGFADNIERIGETHGIDMAFQSLAEGISDEALFDQVRAGRDLTEDQNKQIRAAIAARRRELDLIKEKNYEEGINKAASFFGAQEEMFDYNDFTQAIDDLNGVIKSLDDTIEDLYYSDFNPLPMTEKLEQAAVKYDRLFAAAMTANEDGSYNSEAISEFESFIKEYLGMQQKVYGHTPEFFDVFDQVNKDIRSVQGAASVYGTKSATDKLVEGMGELKEELANLGVADGTIERVDSLITKVKSELPDGLEQSFNVLKYASGTMASDVKSYTSEMVTTMRGAINTVTSEYGSLFTGSNSLSNWISGVANELTDSSNSHSLVSHFDRFIEELKVKVKGFSDNDSGDNYSGGQSFDTGTNGQTGGSGTSGSGTSSSTGTSSVYYGDNSLFSFAAGSTSTDLVDSLADMHARYLTQSGGVEKPFYVFLRDRLTKEDTIYGFDQQTSADKFYTNWSTAPAEIEEGIKRYEVFKRRQQGGSLQSYAKGGFISGPSHLHGGVPLEAEGGEYIMQKSVVEKIGVPFMNYLNEEGGLPFMRFGMNDFLKQDQEVGMTEINSNDGELKKLIRELIEAVKAGDMDVVDALEELDPNVDVRVFTDLEGEVEAQISAYDAKIKEMRRRGR